MSQDPVSIDWKNLKSNIIRNTYSLRNTPPEFDFQLTLIGRGYFTNEKDGGGGHYGPPVYLGSQ